MPSIEYDLKYLQAGVLDLEGYLLSKELYWPTGANPPAGERPYPRMTLGNLLIARKRMEGMTLTGGARVDFERVAARMDETHKQWRTAWEQKAARELAARLNLWRDFLEDYREDPEANVDRYDYEVARRVMIELLKPDAGVMGEAEAELLEGLDRMLKAVFVPGKFIWEVHLMPAFPQTDYWFLYGMPKGE
jgi:hypothetical protein